MSSQVSNQQRRELVGRQPETLEKLLAAARAELDESGHDGLTIRTVASRAGVSTATAYNYFGSRDHLFAELFWRHLDTTAGPELTGRDSTRRLQQTTRHLAETIASAPPLAAAATKSLLGQDPDVARLRLRIGTIFADRFRAAIGAPVDPAGDQPRDRGAEPEVLEPLLMAFSGGLLQTGMGMITYAELADRLDHVVAVLMRGSS
jgi:AcrR family transcriptional regulator